ncbi:hypothetical protein ACFLZP_03940 [Patescibacteria group bacterium]
MGFEKETSEVRFLGERENVYSPLSLVIAFLLGVTLVVLLQFLVKDITDSFYGEPPRIRGQYQSGGYLYKGKHYDDYQKAKKVFEKDELLPFESRAILVRTSINVPLFLLAVTLIFTLGKKGSSLKLATTTFFSAMVINMLVLLGYLTSLIYKIDHRVAIYGVSFILLIVFTASIVYIQDRFRAQKVTS